MENYQMISRSKPELGHGQELELLNYEKDVKETFRSRREEDNPQLFLCSGLLSESSGILSAYNRGVRYKEPNSIWEEEVSEEIGDTLWYLSNICSYMQYNLADCLQNQNLTTTFEENPLTFARLQEVTKKKLEESGIDTKETLLLDIISASGNLVFKYRDKQDGRAYIGNILLYLAHISTNFNLSLNKIALGNIEKVKGLHTLPSGNLPDEGHSWEEQFPRKLQIYFYNIPDATGKGHDQKCKLLYNKVFVGSKLDDNAYDDDGYRFHDAIHLAHIAILGWSPVFRALLKLKRKSRSATDIVEDGQRAIIIEEAIVALNFTYARNRDFFEHSNGETTSISTKHLKLIRNLTKNLEIEKCSYKQWKMAIVEGFKIYKKLKEHKGGLVQLDLNKKTIEHKPMSLDEYRNNEHCSQ